MPCHGKTCFCIYKHIFISQGCLVHFVPCVRNRLDLVTLACEDDANNNDKTEDAIFI